MRNKRYVFDFSADAWIQDVEIEAKSLKEAKEELLKMSLEDLIEKGYVKDCRLDNIDYEQKDFDFEIEITKIVWDESYKSDDDISKFPTSCKKVIESCETEEDAFDELVFQLEREYHHYIDSYECEWVARWVNEIEEE